MKLSVIMPNYNHGDRIGLALESILHQTRPPDEVIVVDDGSTDDSVREIERLMARHPQIRLHTNPENQGPVPTCNTAFRMATGDYIFGFPADDVVLPGWFAQADAMLRAHPGVGVCCGDFYMADVNSGQVQYFECAWSAEPAHYTPEQFAEALKGWWVPTFTSFMNRKALEEAGFYLDDLKWHCDWFLGLVTAFRHGLCHIPFPAAARRRHATAYGTKNRRDWTQQSQVLRNLLAHLKSDAYRDVLPHFIRSGAMLMFNDELDKLVMMNPDLWDIETLLLAGLPIWYRHQDCKRYREAMWEQAYAYDDSEKAARIREALQIAPQGDARDG